MIGAATAFDLARATVAAMAMIVAPWSVDAALGLLAVPPVVAISTAQAQAQPSAPQGGTMNPADQMSMIQWAVKEGGAFGVILVILFFYRRDWKTAVEFWRDQHAITTKLVQDSTAAQVSMEAALQENTRVVHQAKNVMARYLPERRDS